MSSEAIDRLDRALAALRRGGAIVYPTETFYGLGVDATNPQAVERLMRLKGRGAGKPTSVLVSDRAMTLSLVGKLSREASLLIDRFWPGPLTVVLPLRAALPPALSAGTGTIGLRCSSHPVAARLVARLGRPVTTPSANPAGAAPPVTAAEARDYFGASVAEYLDGGTLPGGAGSTVVQLEPELRILRQGAISEAAITAALAELN